MQTRCAFNGHPDTALFEGRTTLRRRAIHLKVTEMMFELDLITCLEGRPVTQNKIEKEHQEHHIRSVPHMHCKGVKQSPPLQFF